MSVPGQESDRSCIFVWGINFATLYDFSIGFWNCCESVIFFVFHFDYHALDNNTTNDDNMILTKIFICEKSQEKRKEASPIL